MDSELWIMDRSSAGKTRSETDSIDVSLSV